MTAPPPRPASARFGDLGARAASGLTLALVAMGAVWLGGAASAVFAAALLLAMLWELHRMAGGSVPSLVALAAAAAAAVALTAVSGVAYAWAALAAGAWLAALLAPQNGGWLAGGLVAMGGALCLMLGLRLSHGAGVILWLVLVVAAADIGAYFVGRTLGGPKLWRAVSPGKTWSGAVGGLGAAAVAGLVAALVAGWPPVATLLLSAFAAVASQAGDLGESAVKRHFGVKDASRLIPGHGGVMDRLDGVMGAAWGYGLLLLLGASVGSGG